MICYRWKSLPQEVELFFCQRMFQNFIDKVKIGKLNYHPSNIDWKVFWLEAEARCKKLGLDYYIKESLRAEMNK